MPKRRRAKPHRPEQTSDSGPVSGRPRLEDGIQLLCCGVPCKLSGNLSLRGAAGASDTRLAYECLRCFRRLQVVDDWGQPSAAQLDIFDTTE